MLSWTFVPDYFKIPHYRDDYATPTTTDARHRTDDVWWQWENNSFNPAAQTLTGFRATEEKRYFEIQLLLHSMTLALKRGERDLHFPVDTVNILFPVVTSTFNQGS